MNADQLKRADGAMEKKLCCGHTSDRLGIYACTKKAKFEREGKWYCGIHDPVARSEKSEARFEKWKAEYQEKEKALSAAGEQKRRADLYDELVEALEEIHSVTKGVDSVICAIIRRKAHTILAKCKGVKA